MLKSILICVIALAISVGGSAAFIHEAGPSTKDLDDDIVGVRAELASVRNDAAHYSGGAILAQIDLRGAILQSTLDMLLQKREQFLRGIKVVYEDLSLRSSDSVDQEDAVVQLAKAHREAESARTEAGQYSGGIIQSLALMRAATADVTAAAIEERQALSRLGIAPASNVTITSAPKPPVGKPTSDKEAL